MNTLEERISASSRFQKLNKTQRKKMLKRETQLIIRNACVIIHYVGFEAWYSQCKLPEDIIEITRDVMKTDPGVSPSYKMSPLIIWLPKIKIRILKNKLLKMDLKIDQTLVGLIQNFIDHG